MKPFRLAIVASIMRASKKILLPFVATTALLLLLTGATLLQPGTDIPANAKVTDLVIHKSDHKLLVMAGQQVLATYRISLGRNPLGDKKCQGDNRTPEGRYTIDGKNPNSSYYKALHISYPNAQDRAEAAQLGCNPGGDIALHGLPNNRDELGALHRLADWTRGCIAVTNEEMDHLWPIVQVGTPIEILP